jgi:hypothetical protein
LAKAGEVISQNMPAYKLLGVARLMICHGIACRLEETLYIKKY